MAGSGPFADDDKCRDFMANLVAMRRMKGWSQPDLAVACQVSKSVISNIESFQRAPLVEHGEAIDTAFGLTDVFRAKARIIQEGASYAPEFRAFADVEKIATDLFIWDHSFVPGIFQVEGYALELMRRYPGVSERLARDRTSARLRRQDILTGENAPRVWALLDESVLRLRVGDAGIMHEQMLHLLAVSDLPGVTVQVVPGMEGHVGRLGAFTIAEVPGRGAIVNVEDITDGRVRDEAAVSDRMRLTFRAMQTQALHVRGSRDLIAKMAEDVWRATATPDGVRALTAARMEGSA